MHLAVGEHLLTHGLALALGEHGVVIVHHFFGLAAHGHAAVFQEDGGVADRLDRRAVVGHDQQRGAGLAEVADAIEAFVLEVGVAHRQRLVDDQDVRSPCRGYAKGQAHLHAAGVGANLMVHGFADFGKALDFGHQRFDFFDLHAEQLAGHEGVLAPGEVWVKPHAQLQQCCDPTFQLDLPAGRLGGAGDHLQQGTFARAVDANDAHRLAGLDLEIDALQHPVQVMAGAGKRHHPFEQPAPAIRVLLVGLAQATDAYMSHQSSSTISPTRWRKSRSPITQNNSPMTSSGISEFQFGHWL